LRSRASKGLLCAAVLGVFLIICAGYSLSRWRYIPAEPLAISRHFIDLVQAGNLHAAYLLTNRGSYVGTSLATFEANIRHQMAIDAFPTDRPVKRIESPRSPQTYGNRFRRWLLGRKLDQDQISFDYSIGGLPFEVRLAFHEGKWQIVYFQLHAA
jgi:hypothetical protein